MSRAIIRTQEVEITYNAGKTNEFKALRNMNVEIMAREYIIFFGPSGCGKSTLLYSIFGVLPPSSGKILVKGDSIYDYTAEEFIQFQRHTMGIMYQQFNLIPSITVLDNVALPLIFAGVPESKREKKALELLDRFGIAHIARKFPTLLSGGQQQRVSVARSLVNEPEILIADEPVGNLDSISSKQVMDMIDHINEHFRTTILLVTHDAKHLPYAHRVFFLKDGRMDRIVANPERNQILKLRPGTSIVTELEQAQRLYPYDSPDSIRVKSIMNFITQNVSFDQIVQIEKITDFVLKGKLSHDAFIDILKKPQSEGGVGLRPEYAEQISHRMFKLLEQAQDIIRFRRQHEEFGEVTTDLNQHDLADQLAGYLILEHRTELTPGQFTNLRQAVDVRVSGYVDKSEFKRQLSIPTEQGGVGLEMHTVHDISHYLEKLIAQGIAEMKIQSKREHDIKTLKAEDTIAAKRAVEEMNARLARRDMAWYKKIPFLNKTKEEEVNS